ncbi:hypothetical protein GCM10019017_25160 [Streptomyces showdoensis]
MAVGAALVSLPESEQAAREKGSRAAAATAIVVRRIFMLFMVDCSSGAFLWVIPGSRLCCPVRAVGPVRVV